MLCGMFIKFNINLLQYMIVIMMMMMMMMMKLIMMIMMMMMMMMFDICLQGGMPGGHPTDTQPRQADLDVFWKGGQRASRRVERMWTAQRPRGWTKVANRIYSLHKCRHVWTRSLVLQRPKRWQRRRRGGQ